MMPLNRADSLTPTTRTTVISATIENARMLKTIGIPRTWGACAMISGLLVRGAVVDRQPGGETDAVDAKTEGMDRDSLEPGLEVVRPGNRDRDVADGVLQDQVPADDPGDELAEGCVRVRVGGPRDRDHRGKLRVAERGEAADDGGEDERHHERGSCARPVNVAGRRRPDRREDPGADDRADAERDQVDRTQHLLELMALLARLGDEIVEGLRPENLVQTAGRVR
jgi:hypothetical protein